MMRRLIALGALGLLSLSACNKTQTPAPAASETPSATPAPVAAAPAPAAVPEVDVNSLPVEEQYEADAEKEITASNLSAQLDALEKEIAAP